MSSRTARQPAAAAGQGASIVVLDLDGVVADVRHRLHHIEGAPRNWDAFFGDAPKDPPLAEGLATAAAAIAEGHQVVYLTGRPERCRTDTETWLAEHGLPEGRIYMRRDDDRRPARFVKLGVLRRLARSNRITAMVDDDVAVVATVRAAGFPVLHATWMNASTSTSGSGSGQDAEEVLFEAQEEEGRT